MANRIVLTALLFGLAVLSGCGIADGESEHQEVSDSSGVQLVHVLHQDHPLPWRLQERWRVGGDEQGPTSFSQLSPENLAATPDGGVAVLDRLAHRVVVLTGRGEVTQALGQEGQGPGELTFPTSVAVLPDRFLWIYDIGKRSVVRFEGDEPSLVDVWAADGRYQGTLPAGTPFPTAVLTDGTLVTIELDEYDVPQVVAWSVLR